MKKKFELILNTNWNLMAAAAADERNFLVDVISRKLIRPDFDNCAIERNADPEYLKANYSRRVVEEIITDEIWQEIAEKIIAWQETRDEPIEFPIDRILHKYNKFPSVNLVARIFGPARAEAYKAALEVMESDARFPSERETVSWKKRDMDDAINIVVRVLAPNCGDDDALNRAYEAFLGKLKIRRSERTTTTKSEDVAAKRKIARSFGIWFPIMKDTQLWRTDARTSSHMPQFEKLMNAVVEKMRRYRSYLQYVPRKKLTSKSCEDLQNNMERMKRYLKR